MLIRVILLASAVLALAACTRPVIEERVETVNVPVSVGCVDGERPVAVRPLKEIYPLPVWETKSVSQKAALVGAQALRRQSYGDGVAGATAGCR